MHTHTHTKTDTLPIYHKGSSNNHDEDNVDDKNTYDRDWESCKSSA